MIMSHDGQYMIANAVKKPEIKHLNEDKHASHLVLPKLKTKRLPPPESVYLQVQNQHQKE